jgi:hypothetical protein
MKLLFLSSAFSFGFSETVVDHARDMEKGEKVCNWMWGQEQNFSLNEYNFF